MFDVLTIAALSDELRAKIVPSRVQRVFAIDRWTFGLECYAGKRWYVLVSIAPQDAWVTLQTEPPTHDPSLVTPFLLLLRKYVRGGRLTAVSQPDLERVLFLDFEHWLEDDDEEGRLVQTRLALEVMGRYSNAVLVAQESGKILDALKRVTPDMSSARPVLPGRPYTLPPSQLKHDPRGLSPALLAGLLRDQPPQAPLSSALVQTLLGFSPQMAREAAYRACGDPALPVHEALEDPEAIERLAAAIAAILQPLADHSWEPSVYLSQDEAVAFAAISLSYLRGMDVERYTWISEAIQRYRQARQQAKGVAESTQERYAARRQRLLARIQEERARLEARIRSLEQELARSADAERLREMGEMLYAYLHTITPGQTALDVDGMTIPLDPQRSPVENAQHYFELYRKAKAALSQLPERLEAARTELAYLEQLATLVELADTAETLEQLGRELEDYRTHRQSPAPAARQRQATKLRSWRTPSGDRIYVGRNGAENERITFEIARPHDTWLHVRGMPGAHVVVRWNSQPNEETLQQAAALAAWFSRGRTDTRVAVDATERRFVQRIPNAGPGMVRYRNERTLSVRPKPPEELPLVPA